MKLKRIVADMATDNLGAARRFYQDVLGLGLLMDQGWMESLLLNTVASGSTGNTEKCWWPSRVAAPPRWVDIAIAAPAADIPPPSHTTRAETGIARGARATRACAGSRRVNGNCWLRAHPQFRLPRQPEPRYAVAAVLSTTRRLRENDTFSSIIVHRPN
jgi:catechol 2,3-dioxygenase-like lactoylglutathione lyase family enzyme